MCNSISTKVSGICSRKSLILVPQPDGTHKVETPKEVDVFRGWPDSFACTKVFDLCTGDELDICGICGGKATAMTIGDINQFANYHPAIRLALLS